MTELDVSQIPSLEDLEALAATGPVHVQREGRDVAIVLSPDEYEDLLRAAGGGKVRPLVVELYRTSIRKYGRVYEALADMEKKFDPPQT